MPKSLQEILKAAGKNDAEIKAIIDPLGGNTALFEKILQDADTANAQAAQRLTDAATKEKQINDFWNNEATPQINKALSEKATAEARANYYRTQNEEARKAGFIAADAPGYEPANNGGGNNGGNGNGNGNANGGQRDGNGRFVSGQNEVPGSPAYMTLDQGTEAISTAAYLLTEHQRLFSEPLPNLRELMTEASQSRRKAIDVWEEKYKVRDKRTSIAEAARLAEREAIRKEEREKLQVEFGNMHANENTRTMLPSRYPNVLRDKDTKAANKLAWTDPNKRENLRSRILEQVSKETVVH
jgi:hypothetical protein